MLAIDQRGSFVKALKEALKRPVEKQDVIKVKKEIISAIAPYASAVLLDPVYCIGLRHYVPRKTGILFCEEKSGYVPQPKGRKTVLQPHFSVKKSKELGADAAKLNLYYNPDAPKQLNAHQQKLAKFVGDECKKYDLPFLLEFVVYPLKGDSDSPGFAKKRPNLILKTAKEFAKEKYGVDVLKVQFPCDLRYVKEFKKKFGEKRNPVYTKARALQFCKKLTKAVKQPWVLLTAGVAMDRFVEQLKIAKKGGCAGFLAGRAVWQDALKIINPAERRKWIQSQAVKNFKTLCKIMKGG